MDLKVEDLFYNTPTRLAALRSSADEYKRILDVVTQYAVHNPNISFQCKKVNDTTNRTLFLLIPSRSGMHIRM